MKFSHQRLICAIAGATSVYLAHAIGLSVGWSWAIVCMCSVIAEMIFGD